VAVEHSLHVREVAAGGAERHARRVVDGGCDSSGRGHRRRMIGGRVGAGCSEPRMQVVKLRPQCVDLRTRDFSLAGKKGRWRMGGAA
jgi:hypothetical protein